MSPNCIDFITKCLEKDPKNRLGTIGDIEEITSHPWFADVNIKALLAKQLKVEFKPKLSKNELDVSNFDKMFTSDEAVHSVLPSNAVSKIKEAGDVFKGFEQK